MGLTTVLEMLVPTEYWDRVRMYRERRGMSREELARAAELTSSYIFRIEGGKVLTPSYKTMKAIAGALHVSVPELMGDETRQQYVDLSKLSDPYDLVDELYDRFHPHMTREEFRRIVAKLFRADARVAALINQQLDTYQSFNAVIEELTEKLEEKAREENIELG